MVTRKPVPQSAGLAPHGASLPYPVTSISAEAPQSFQNTDGQQHFNGSYAEDDVSNVWGDEGQETRQDHISSAEAHALSKEPPSFGPAGHINTQSQEKLKPQLTSTNPFLQRIAQNGIGKDSSAAAWGGNPEKPVLPSTASPSPSIHISQSQDQIASEFTNLSVSESSLNPWHPPQDEKPGTISLTRPTMVRQDSGNEVWSETPPARESPTAHSSVESHSPALINLDEPESPAWDEDEESASVVHEIPAINFNEVQQLNDDSHAWDENPGHHAGQPAASQFVAREDTTQSGEGWNIVEHEGNANDAQQSGAILADGTTLYFERDNKSVPGLPPRPPLETPAQPPQPQEPPPQLPRPTINIQTQSRSSIVNPGTPPAVQRQKKETYEIKKISWHDVNANRNPRVTPILVQNANGPCPLLALVNALTISTPADVETALVETLRSREQVSLGLLLDAVIDELMSGRRGDGENELPDVSDLYQFLITLHTGMNVNPCFFPPVATKKSNDPRNSMTHIHPIEREDTLPGTFEETREMKLYSTFSVPLIHGWIPEKDSPAHVALSRSAKSYEDAQNLMFHEEGLEEKLQREGLSFEEQAILEDIATIKAFFMSNATQLTPFGLETITTSVAPGAIAILFRNDHFSTLYRHPSTLQLLQLVTDMGYAGHEEVVWESLIDVSGEKAEFFSGDFRLVGGTPATTHSNSHESGNGWTTVATRRGSAQSQSQHRARASSSSNYLDVVQDPPHSPNIEQEDHDLALALQLQEEEEQRHAEEQARRRRETELSQQFIEQQGQGQGQGQGSHGNVAFTAHGGRGGQTQGHGGGGSMRGGAPESRPIIPPRRNNQTMITPATVPAPDPEAGTDAPPPSYEQAANQAAYVPPSDHPAHPNASPLATNGRRMSAYTATSSSQGLLRGRRGTANSPALLDQTSRRMNSHGQIYQQEPQKEKDCNIM